jgi:hypothetical protein
METRERVVAPAVVGAITFTVGAAVAWFVIDRRYRRMVMEAIDELEEEVRQTRKRESAAPLVSREVVEDTKPLAEIASKYLGEVKEAVSEAVVRQHIFSNTSDEWDWEAEKLHRSKAQIYIITHEEFMNSERDWPQDQLTYYAGDQVLCDLLEKPIYNHTQFVGHDLRFGHGSGDPNVVYIRNEREQMEYEVTLHTGHYLVEVQGLEIEEEYERQDLKHSASPLRFRKE